MDEIWILIAGMTLVTYFPRCLPLLARPQKPLKPFWRPFLQSMPYAALGALILPNGLNAVSGYPGASIFGLLLTACLALRFGNPAVLIFGALTATAVCLRFMPF